MAANVRRRNRGDDSIYFDAANNCWAGAVSLGFAPDGKRRIRRKVTGRTKTQVKDKLKALHRELDAGIHSSASYTMVLCIEDWLSRGLAGLSPSTAANYRHLADHAISKLGAVRLRDLTARHVQVALTELSGSLSTRSLRLVHQIIERAIKHAQAADLVNRNVASLITAPEGRSGRPSRSLTLGQATAVGAHVIPQVEASAAHVIPQGGAHVIPHRDGERVGVGVVLASRRLLPSDRIDGSPDGEENFRRGRRDGDLGPLGCGPVAE